MSRNLLPNTCTAVDPCNSYFRGMGFRPGMFVIQRDQYGDKPILIVADDHPFEGKVPVVVSSDFLDAMSFGKGMVEAGNQVTCVGSATIVPATRDDTDLAPVPLPPSAAALLIAILVLIVWGGGRRSNSSLWTKQ